MATFIVLDKQKHLAQRMGPLEVPFHHIYMDIYIYIYGLYVYIYFFIVLDKQKHLAQRMGPLEVYEYIYM